MDTVLLPFCCFDDIVVMFKFEIDGLVQDCSNSIANAQGLLQSCTIPSLWDLCDSHTLMRQDIFTGTWATSAPGKYAWKNNVSI